MKNKSTCVKLSGSKKSQAAIEFLMTYGWAVMASLIAIAALAYFGLSSPSNKLPDKCLFSNNFNCEDYQIKIIGIAPFKEINLRISNGMGQTIYPVDVVPTEDTLSGTCWFVLGVPAQWSSGDTLQIQCTPSQELVKDSKFKYKVTIRYKKTPVTGFTNSALGEVYATVQ